MAKNVEQLSSYHENLQIQVIDMNFFRCFLLLQSLTNMVSEETLPGVETISWTGNNGWIYDVISLNGEL